MIIRPQLAEDAILEKVRFPVIVQPKIDGVRAPHITGQLTGRSLEPFEGFGVSEMFSNPVFRGLDGEMTLGSNPTGDRLCSLTTGAMGRFKGVTEAPDLHWWVFDLVTPVTVKLPYRERLQHLTDDVVTLGLLGFDRVHLIPSRWAHDAEELQEIIAEFFAAGYEGAILRNPDAPYKEGRATQAGQEIWRVKPWADAEIRVTGVTEGAVNTNAAKKNALGHTERSSAKEGLVPNGQVGSIQGRLLADFHCPFTKRVLFTKDQEITVGSGKLTVKEATHYFQNQDEILGHIVKFKHMPFGIKDQPRFPTYLSHRLPQDLS
jgi:DNA ligase-1